jgi:hypothetical protein
MKRLLLVVVLAAACLGGLAAPAFAAYPMDGVPGTAYVHPWGGTDPVYWDEFFADGSSATWSVAEPGFWWAPYKPITRDYNICFAAWMAGWPKLQVAAWPLTTRIDCVLYNPNGSKRWSISPTKARKDWGPVLYGWDGQTIYKENAKIWLIGWTCPIGKLPPGTYSGTGNFTFLAPYFDFELGYRTQLLPKVIPASEWNAANPYTYTFTVK